MMIAAIFLLLVFFFLILTSILTASPVTLMTLFVLGAGMWMLMLVNQEYREKKRLERNREINRMKREKAELDRIKNGDTVGQRSQERQLNVCNPLVKLHVSHQRTDFRLALVNISYNRTRK